MNLNVISNVKPIIAPLSEQPNFGYKSPLKPLIELDAYTGEILKAGNRTFEHIHPHSKGGKNTIANCLITGAPINHERGNMDFSKWLKIKPSVAQNIQNYLDKYRNLVVNGQNYVKAVLPTLNNEAKGVVTFHGNNKKLNLSA